MQAWFQPKSSRKDAENLLLLGDAGAFLIRLPSNPMHFMLDVLAKPSSGPRVGHVLLPQILRDGTLFTRLPGTPHVFQHLFDLVRFCHFNPFHFDWDQDVAVNLSIALANRTDRLHARNLKIAEIAAKKISEAAKDKELVSLTVVMEKEDAKFLSEMKIENEEVHLEELGNCDAQEEEENKRREYKQVLAESGLRETESDRAAKREHDMVMFSQALEKRKQWEIVAAAKAEEQARGQMEEKKRVEFKENEKAEKVRRNSERLLHVQVFIYYLSHVLKLRFQE